MSDTFISCVNKLACNEPNHFILTYLIGCPIGDIYITGVNRDAADSIKISPRNTLLTSYRQQKRQRRIHAYQIPTLTSTKTMRHPHNRYRHPRDHLKIQSNNQWLLRRKYIPDQTSAGVRRSVRVRTHTKSYTPIMAVNWYTSAAA